MRFDHPVPGHFPGLKQLWKAAFADEDAFIDRFFAAAFSPERCLCATDGDAVVAGAYWFDVEFSGKKAAYIYAVATLPEYRGKGLCRELMAQIHAHLAKQDYAGAILVPGDPGLREMYSRMGYVNFGGIKEFTCAAEGVPAEITQISPDEFALLRRQYLPDNGVVQEESNLTFLRQFYRFYRGSDFLLAAASTGCELFASELLGNQAAAPAILAALGVPSGVFRVPGDGEFAMYRSLDGQNSPAYFAFAFD